MTYKMSKTQLLMRNLGVDSITLRYEQYENNCHLEAKQYVILDGRNIQTITLRVRSRTYSEGISEILRRAEIIKETSMKQPETFAEPDAGRMNILGHIREGNIETVEDM